MKVKYEVISSALYIPFKLLDCFLRFERHNYNPETSPAIYAIWHGWQYCLGGLSHREKLHILISLSNDGELITHLVKKLKFSVIRGSMGRGGMKAAREIIKALKNGKNIAYTVDGPKGPGFEVKPGIIRIAQISQKPIIPTSSAFKHGFEFNSWDKYQIPLPGTRVALMFGDPIYVPKNLSEESVEEYRLKLEKELFRLREEAKRKVLIR